ncbi:MAG: protease inhibitor I42 family protein [Phycisphaeraceae bacterium]|nr:protease inhibitor I42 family protein [Phycisphaeraceae bacterium]
MLSVTTDAIDAVVSRLRVMGRAGWRAMRSAGVSSMESACSALRAHLVQGMRPVHRAHAVDVACSAQRAMPGAHSMHGAWARAASSVAVMIACVLIVTGCNSASSLPPGSAKVRVAEGRRDAEISMSGVLQVELLGHAGTGFDWRLAAIDRSLFEMTETPHVTPLDPGVIGGRTITTFTFRPLRPGQCTLVFEMVRPPSWNEPPGRVVQVEARVASGGR